MRSLSLSGIDSRNDLYQQSHLVPVTAQTQGINSLHNCIPDMFFVLLRAKDKRRAFICVVIS